MIRDYKVEELPPAYLIRGSPTTPTPQPINEVKSS